MNNFRIFFKETTTLSIDGEKITFLKGKTAAFKNINNKDTKAIRKAVIKGDTMIFSLTDNTVGVYKVVYGNKKEASKASVEEKVKSFKGSKKDRFKNYVPKETKAEEPEAETEQEGVKITQNSLTEESESEIIITEEDTNE